MKRKTIKLAILLIASASFALSSIGATNEVVTILNGYYNSTFYTEINDDNLSVFNSDMTNNEFKSLAVYITSTSSRTLDISTNLNVAASELSQHANASVTATMIIGSSNSSRIQTVNINDNLNVYGGIDASGNLLEGNTTDGVFTALNIRGNSKVYFKDESVTNLYGNYISYLTGSGSSSSVVEHQAGSKITVNGTINIGLDTIIACDFIATDTITFRAGTTASDKDTPVTTITLLEGANISSVDNKIIIGQNMSSTSTATGLNKGVIALNVIDNDVLKPLTLSFLEGTTANWEKDNNFHIYFTDGTNTIQTEGDISIGTLEFSSHNYVTISFSGIDKEKNSVLIEDILVNATDTDFDASTTEIIFYNFDTNLLKVGTQESSFSVAEDSTGWYFLVGENKVRFSAYSGSTTDANTKYDDFVIDTTTRYLTAEIPEPLPDPTEKIYLWDLTAMQKNKSLLLEGDPDVTSAYNTLIEEAEEVLVTDNPSVMEKPASTTGTYDMHDYVSLARYWWPDYENGDPVTGEPYVRNDGVSNPEIYDYDRYKLSAMADGVNNLTLAYYFSGEEKYAQKAVSMIKTWFLDEETYMNPNLNYAQIQKGHSNDAGNYTGVIDSASFVDMLDATQYLIQTNQMSTEDAEALIAWFTEMKTWYTTASLASEADSCSNNIAVSFDTIVTRVAMFCEDYTLAREIVSAFPSKRLDTQINSDGRQPNETSRTLAFHYSTFNLIHMLDISQMSDYLSIDTYAASDYAIRSAIDWLMPYAKDPSTFPYEQISGWDTALCNYARVVYRASKLEDSSEKIEEYVSFYDDFKANLDWEDPSSNEAGLDDESLEEAIEEYLTEVLESALFRLDTYVIYSNFENWAIENGLSLDDSLATATPFYDNITNAEKFVFGLSANKSTVYTENSLFSYTTSESVSSLTYPVNKDSTEDYSVVAYQSEDLINWTEVDSISIGDEGDFDIYNVESEIPASGKIFIKLEVIQQ